MAPEGLRREDARARSDCGECAGDGNDGWKSVSAREMRESPRGLQSASLSQEDQDSEDPGGCCEEVEARRVQEEREAGADAQRSRSSLGVDHAGAGEDLVDKVLGMRARITKESPGYLPMGSSRSLPARVHAQRKLPFRLSELDGRVVRMEAPSSSRGESGMERRRALARGFRLPQMGARARLGWSLGS